LGANSGANKHTKLDLSIGLSGADKPDTHHAALSIPQSSELVSIGRRLNIIRDLRVDNSPGPS
jgi:hypothetical protein